MKILSKRAAVMPLICGSLFFVSFQNSPCLAEGVKWENSLYVTYIDKSAKTVEDLRSLLDEKWDSEVVVNFKGMGDAPVVIRKCTDLIGKTVVGTVPEGPRTFSYVLGLKQNCTAIRYVSYMREYETSYLPYSAAEIARLLFAVRRRDGGQAFSAFMQPGEKVLQGCFAGNECVFVDENKMQYSVSVVALGDYNKDSIADLVLLLRKKQINGAGAQYLGLLITRTKKSSKLDFIETF